MRFLSKLLKPKHAVAGVVWVASIVDHLRDQFKSVQLYEHRFKPSFILHVCRVVEADYRDKTEKLDKKQAVKDILRQLIPSLSEPDLVQIDGIIEDLHSSGLITAPSSAKALKKLVMAYFSK